MYPKRRMRRLRSSEGMRAMTREVTVDSDDLIYPLFVVSGRNRREKVPSLPGVKQFSVDLLPEAVADVHPPAVLLFGVPDADRKDTGASAALDDGGIVPRAIRRIKEERPDLVVITDVCLCAYMSHGHCGVVRQDGQVDNDATLDLIAEMAEVHAGAGADVVAPSGMMDGQVGAIRAGLDAAGHEEVSIMSYAAKFASSFYGPFRDIAHSAPDFGDRRRYQLPASNRREALRDALLDEGEGADWLMVKPAMPYLDVLTELRGETRLPISAYQVSGEYAMIKSAAERDRIDEKRVVLESLTAIKRAGADSIITYYAEKVCEWL